MSRLLALKNIHYPVRKKKVVERKFGIEEPVRTTILDVLKDNLDIADRKTFLHRVIYVGEHTFVRDEMSVAEIFSETVKQTNAVFHNEKLTGMLLCYRKYFIHMLEGDEDAINQQIRLFFNHSSFTKYKELKLLLHLCHIKQRFISEWNYYFGVPPKLLGDIKLDCSVPEAGRQVYTCIRKFYNFVWQFVLNNYYRDEISDSGENLNREEAADLESTRSDSFTRTSSLISFRSSLTGMCKEPYRGHLPESELIEFVLKNEHTQSLRSYMKIYGDIPQRIAVKDRVWPIPGDFVPYDIFTTPLQIVMELPKTRQKELTRTTMASDSEDPNLTSAVDDPNLENFRASVADD